MHKVFFECLFAFVDTWHVLVIVLHMILSFFGYYLDFVFISKYAYCIF
jgi:hypothetical protein